MGLAARRIDETLQTVRAQALEQDLIFLGLIALFDPPRPEVPSAIAQCHGAGVKVTLVTGDDGLTAEAIARKIGLVGHHDSWHNCVRVITGDGMGHLSDAQLRQILKYRSSLVFARMSPEHKLRLVQAYKDIGKIVAVTGDGVNDAPALRAAHVGIAMGMNGTDVAREAADIVLMDDNFATIVRALELGRTIYQNIRKFMTYPPCPKHAFLLNAPLLLRAYGFLGMIETMLSLFGFYLVWWSHGYAWGDLPAVTPLLLNHTADPTVTAIYRQATTVTLAAIVACQMGNLFACRSEWGLILRLPWRDKPIVMAGHRGRMCGFNCLN